ncbi:MULTISPECIES: flagellar biosynthetic protein FliO [unclassified Sphingomonas]|jgi:flagellar protein FliO/FliZ|uniref:flagellar biosynthetic protein FliO n=1 Tax=unclassified Sphingomonas TaxID=196159 RepID=UPI000B280317|nr:MULTISPECIES: flagellar biosynthetic protein FliO [unclassified Sphingomonas]RMB34169.1 flagellar protein FliO/FliZ [Sphingomonas sp. PP-F2F-G114-C0414]TCP72453.1 flagellar protein FliO/FliZ [Sphingomonas sp. PP-CE-1G-424]
MDIAALLRTMGGLGVVLGMLAAALWLVRRYDIALPGRVGVKLGRRVELVERIQIDGKRSIILVRRDDREHLFVLHPDRATILETRIVRADEEAQAIADLEQAEGSHSPVLCKSLEEAWFNA